MLNSDINYWTFGIITEGKRNDAMEKIIQSIHKLKIPSYEIIVCGNYFNRLDITYIHFIDDLPRITKKKNIICQSAKYENMVIIHDRIIFNSDWFTGMKKYGNNFDVLSCKILYKWFGAYFRADDWCVYPPGICIAYNQWSPEISINGGLIILKHSLWEKVKWDETMFYPDDYEDLDYSKRVLQSGARIEFNPYSSCETLTWKHRIARIEDEPERFKSKVFNFLYYSKLKFKHFKNKVKKTIKGELWKLKKLS